MKFSYYGIPLVEHTRVGFVKIIIAKFRTHEHLFSLGREFVHVAVVTYLKQVVTCVPSTLFRYVYGDYVIFLLVEGIHCLQCRNHGNLMFYRTPTEKYCYIRFHQNIYVFE